MNKKEFSKKWELMSDKERFTHAINDNKNFSLYTDNGVVIISTEKYDLSLRSREFSIEDVLDIYGVKYDRT